MAHETKIEKVPSFSAFSTAQVAKCSCGWVGQQRGLREMADDDAKEHVKSAMVPR